MMNLRNPDDKIKCTDLTPVSILCEILTINHTQAKILLYVMKHGNVSIKDITDEMNINRSTATKNLRWLMDFDMVERNETHLSRGFRYVYHCKDSCKAEIVNTVQAWFERLKTEFLNSAGVS